MTPNHMVREMTHMGLGTARIDQMGRPAAILGGHLVVIWPEHEVGGFPDADMPEPVKLCLYAPDSSPTARRWEHHPSESWAGLTAAQALRELARLL